MSRRKRSTSTRFSLFSFQDIITCVMGIMLLLTLLICLRITSTVSRSSSEVKTRAQALQTSVSAIQSELAELEARVHANSSIMESGGLSNIQLLRDKQQEAEAARRAAERELYAMLEQSTVAVRNLTDVSTSAQSQQTLTAAEIASLIEEMHRQQKTIKEIQDGKRVVYNQYIGSADTCWIIEVSSDTVFQVAPVGKKQAPLSFSSIDQVLQWTRQRHNEGAEFLVLLKPGANAAIDRIPGTLREEGIAHGYDLLGQDQTALDPVTGAEAQ
jgi:hypothetical protein